MQALASTYRDIITRQAYANSCVRLRKIAVSQESSAIPSRCDWSLYAIDARSLSRHSVAEFATIGRRNEMWRACMDLSFSLRQWIGYQRSRRRNRHYVDPPPWRLRRARGQTATIYMTIIKKKACCARLFTVHRLTPWVRGVKGRERKKKRERETHFPEPFN